MKTQPSSVLTAAALLTATLALAANASAFTEVARGALTLTTTGRVAYDSNVVGNATEQEDLVFTVAPTLNYSRAAGLGTIEASLGVSINRYADLTAFDSEDILAAVHVGLPTPEGARQQGSFDAGYSDRSDIDETVGARIRAKTWSTSFTGSYRAGPRTDLRLGASFSDTTRDIFSDQTQWTAGVGLDYNDFLGGFGLSGDYRYTDTESSSFLTVGALDQSSHHLAGGVFYKFISGLRASLDAGYRWTDRAASETASGETSDNSFTFGLRLDGPFLPPSRIPKHKSTISLGLEQGQTLGLNDTGSTTLVGGLSLAWQARERTALSFNASRKQGLSSTNLSTVTNMLQLGVEQAVGARGSLSASLGQEWSSFPGTGRDDRRTRGSAGFNYSFNRNWQAGTSYTATLSRSSHALHDYDRHLVSGFLSCTF